MFLELRQNIEPGDRLPIVLLYALRIHVGVGAGSMRQWYQYGDQTSTDLMV